MNKKLAVGMVAIGALVACETGPSNRQVAGAGIGALAGAAAGTLAGGDDGRNAAIGAAVGAIAGAGVGTYMDRQERAMRQATANTQVQVERRGDNLLLTMPSSLTFDVNSADIKPQFSGTLNEVSGTLNEFPETRVDIIGHASSDGADDYNQRLSEQRAASVQSALVQRGVAPVRMNAYGMGESQPLPGIPTTDPANRRVEILIQPVVEGQAQQGY